MAYSAAKASARLLSTTRSSTKSHLLPTNNLNTGPSALEAYVSTSATQRLMSVWQKTARVSEGVCAVMFLPFCTDATRTLKTALAGQIKTEQDAVGAPEIGLGNGAKTLLSGSVLQTRDKDDGPARA